MSLLQRDPLFACLSAQMLDHVISAMTELALRPGQEVFQAGDEGDALYLVTEGRARVVAPAGDGSEVNLGVLGPGSYFGELALVTGAPRSATVRAIEDLRLLRLDRDRFLDVVKETPGLEDRLQDILQADAIRGFLRRMGRMIPGAQDLFEETAGAVTPRTVAGGTVILEQGQQPDDVYIVESGQVEVLKSEGERTWVVGELGTGAFFGELGALTGSPRTATVVARDEVELLVMPGDTYLKLFAPDPASKERLLNQLATFRLRRDEPSPGAEQPPVREEGTGEPAEIEGLPVHPSPFPGATGQACLEMVLEYHRLADGEPMPEILDGDLDERSVWFLTEAAESVGFAARCCPLRYEQLAKAGLPAIVPYRGKGFVVVYRADPVEVVVGDPGTGLRRLTPGEFQRGWSGRTVLVRPRSDVNTGADGAGMLLPILRPHRKILSKIIVAAIILNGFGLVIPFLTQFIIDRVVVHRSMSLLQAMSSGVVLIAIFTLMLQGLQKYWSIWIATRANFALVDHFYRHSLELPIAYYAKNKVGDITGRFEENEHVQEFLVEHALKGLLNLVLVIMYTGTMLALNLELGGIVVAYIPLYFGITYVTAPWITQLAEKAFYASVGAESSLIESIGGIHTVKALAIEEPVQRRWEGHFTEYVQHQFSGFRLSLMLTSGTSFLTSVATTTIMFFGASKVLNDQMSIGALMAFYALMNQVMEPVSELIGFYGKYQMALMSMDRVNEVLTVTPEEEPEGRRYRTRLSGLEGGVVFEDVKFSYSPPDGPLILKGINLQIEPGEMVAVVGRSGAGKSTLAHLLLRMQRPTEGRILIDGCDLEWVDGSSLRHHIGVILQDNFLFSGTIRQNIAPFQEDADFEKIQSAAILGGAHEFIMNLPLGYDTIIGERGASLSGGQKQRLAISRALYTDPKILIMDEATSALDTESERAIQDNLQKLLKGRTTLVIAHRLSTVQQADKIVCLDSGHIVECGSHDALMARKGLYYHLASQQIEE